MPFTWLAYMLSGLHPLWAIKAFKSTLLPCNYHTLLPQKQTFTNLFLEISMCCFPPTTVVWEVLAQNGTGASAERVRCFLRRSQWSSVCIKNSSLYSKWLLYLRGKMNKRRKVFPSSICIWVLFPFCFVIIK